MTWQEFALLMMSLITNVAGQYLLKAGALKLGRVSPGNAVSHILRIATTPELVFGLACYGLGAIAYILLLTRVKLSVTGPAIALAYVFSVLIGYFLFKEPVPMHRLAGLAFIVSGVLLVLWQK